MKWKIEFEDKENIFRGAGDCEKCPIRLSVGGKTGKLYCIATGKDRMKCPVKYDSDGQNHTNT